LLSFQVKVWFQNRRMKHKRQSVSKQGEDGEDDKDSPGSVKSKDPLLIDENSKKSCQNCELTPTGLEVTHIRGKSGAYNNNSRSGASSVASSSSSFEKMATEDDSRSNDTIRLSPKGDIKLERKESPVAEKRTPPVCVIQPSLPAVPPLATPTSPMSTYPRPRSSPTVVTTVTATVLHPSGTRPFQQHSRPPTPRSNSQNYRHTYYLQQQYQNQFRQTTPPRANGMHSPRPSVPQIPPNRATFNQQQYQYGNTQQQYNGYQQDQYQNYHRNFSNYQEQEYQNNYPYFQNQSCQDYYEHHQNQPQQHSYGGQGVKNEAFFESQDEYVEFSGGPGVLTPPTGLPSEPPNDQINHFHHFYSEPHHNPSPADTSNSSSDFNFLSNLANDFAPEYYQLS